MRKQIEENYYKQIEENYYKQTEEELEKNYREYNKYINMLGKACGIEED